MHACHDSWRSFHTEEAANAFSANLKSGLRLLFAERYTHTYEGDGERNLASLSNISGCSSLACHSGLTSQQLQLGEPGEDACSHCSAWGYWQVPIFSSCQNLAP